MDLIDQLQALAAKIQKQRDFTLTEEATKTAFVMPFIHTMGYDVFNPMEVVPEFTADVGIKRGEKVDYAIMQDGKPIMLFECKKCGDALDRNRTSQLYRYFSVTEARIAVLTDGIVYQFFTDLEDANKLDEKPFMEINILDLQESLLPELKKLTKTAFDLEQTLNAASELKYAKEVRRVLSEEIAKPSEEFVRFFIGKVYSGRATQSVKEHFTDIVKRALQQFINDRIKERFDVALAGNKSESQPEEPAPENTKEQEEKKEKESKVVTTEEEQEAFYLVKSIIRDVVDPERVTSRDGVTYFSVLLDDNNRKPICRLHFNRSQKYIGLFDQDKNEERIPIESLNDIYRYGERLKGTITYYDKPEEHPAPSQSIEVPAEPSSTASSQPPAPESSDTHPQPWS